MEVERWRPGVAGQPLGAQNPQHTFTAPGTYQVCLLVTDANGRHGGHCAPVVVPAGAAVGTASARARPPAAGGQVSKRTVASTALSSPIS